MFGWRPWRTLAEGKEGGREREEKEKKGEMVDRKGVWGGFGGEGNGGEEAVWGVLGLVWPKPGECLSFCPVAVRRGEEKADNGVFCERYAYSGARSQDVPPRARNEEVY